MANFTPVNRHIWIFPIESKKPKEKKTTILVPDDYKVAESPYKAFKVNGVAEDCTSGVSPGETIVVENSMVSEIELDSEKIYLVLENYVYGTYRG